MGSRRGDRFRNNLDSFRAFLPAPIQSRGFATERAAARSAISHHCEELLGAGLPTSPDHDDEDVGMSAGVAEYHVAAIGGPRRS